MGREQHSPCGISSSTYARHPNGEREHRKEPPAMGKRKKSSRKPMGPRKVCDSPFYVPELCLAPVLNVTGRSFAINVHVPLLQPREIRQREAGSQGRYWTARLSSLWSKVPMRRQLLVPFHPPPTLGDACEANRS